MWITSAADGLDNRRAIALLNRALATGLVCVFRYRRHLCLAGDVYGAEARQRLLRQAREEERHAERIAQRIAELGGVPDLRVETLAARSFVSCPVGRCDPQEVFLPSLLDDELAAQEIAADAYREIIEEIGARDRRTCALLAELVAAEEAHAAGLSGLLRRAAGGGAPELSA